MDEATSDRPHYFRSRHIVVENFVDHPCTLTTKDYPLPGCNLKYEYATLTSNHRPVASGVFRWIRSAISHCNTQNGRELVNEMVEVFRRHKHEIPESLREFMLVDGILRVCYRVQIDDSQLMRKVLDLLYEKWSSYEVIQSLGVLISSYFGYTGGSKSNSSYADFLTFYFEHARRLKLEYNGIRSIDKSAYGNGRYPPVFFVAVSLYWKPLLRYLQFGAKFENVMSDGVQCDLTDVLRQIIKELWFLLVEPATTLSLTNPREIQEFCSNLERIVHTRLRALQIILRTVKQLPHNSLDFVIRDFSVEPVVEVASDRVINHPAIHVMLPTLSQRYRCPIQLQHACRWAIRARLNENWQLPAGIHHLPTSNKMKKYLNLLLD